MTISGLVDDLAFCRANKPPLPSGLVSDLEFCKGEIEEAEADIKRAERRIEYYRREIARIEALIEKASQ